MRVILSAFLGGIFISDATALGQLMLSRPIFCAPIIGIILGDIQTGLYVGMIMELVWITVIPLGNVVPPDASVVAISASALAASGGLGRGYVVFLILALVPFGILYKKLDMLQREFNVYFAHKAEHHLEVGDTSYINAAILESSLLFFFKGFLFLLILIYSGGFIFSEIYSILPSKGIEAFNEIYHILPAVGFGTAVTTFMFKKSQSKR